MKKLILLTVFAISSTMAFANLTDPKVLLHSDEPQSSPVWLEKDGVFFTEIAATSCELKEDVPCVYCSACGEDIICVQCTCGDCDIALEVLWILLCYIGCCYGTDPGY